MNHSVSRCSNALITKHGPGYTRSRDVRILSIRGTVAIYELLKISCSDVSCQFCVRGRRTFDVGNYAKGYCFCMFAIRRASLFRFFITLFCVLETWILPLSFFVCLLRTTFHMACVVCWELQFCLSFFFFPTFFIRYVS